MLQVTSLFLLPEIAVALENYSQCPAYGTAFVYGQEVVSNDDCQRLPEHGEYLHDY
jgi:hypothetical protein